MQKLLFYSFRRDVQNLFGVVWHPFCPSLPCCFAVRESKFFPWRQEVEAVAETHAKASFYSFRRDVRHFLGVVWHSFCASLPCCFAVREDTFFPWGQLLEAVAESFFSRFSEGTFGTFSRLFGTRFVFHCHDVLPFGTVGFSHGDKR